MSDNHRTILAVPPQPKSLLHDDEIGALAQIKRLRSAGCELSGETIDFLAELVERVSKARAS